MVQNLWWAAGYKVVAIRLSAGVFSLGCVLVFMTDVVSARA